MTYSAPPAGVAGDPKALGSMAGYDLPVWPYRACAEQRTGRSIRHQVVVVGAGVTGLTLACDLALRGVPVVLLDDDDTIGVRGLASRGICYAKRTLEIFDRLGIADRVVRKGVTWRVGKVLSGADCVYEFDLQPQQGDKFPAFVNLQQFYVEWFLAERLLELPNVEIRWKNQVTDIALHDDHAALTVDTPDGQYQVQAEWVLACDGASSRVRESLGLQPKDQRGADRWCISDVKLAADFPVERWTWIEAPFNESRGVWRHRMADDVWRLDFQLGPDADPDEISRRDIVERRVRTMLGEGVPFELVWAGPWAYRTYVLDRFRLGRVLFLGDSAHLMSPFGARGGNSGIQDSDNLGWKLAALLQGEATEALLDTYEAERREAALVNVQTTSRSARFMAPAGPVESLFRHAVLALAADFPFARVLVNPGRLSAPSDYTQSPLCAVDADEFAGGPKPGQAAPDAPFGNGFLTEHFRDFVLLVFDPSPNPPAALPPENQKSDRGCAADGGGGRGPQSGRVGAYATITIPLDESEAWRRYNAKPGTAYLIRPDGHVAARWRKPDAATIAAALDRARGRPAA